MDLSFKKAEKLRKNSEFLKVYRQGKKHYGRYLLIYVVFKSEYLRKAGFVVSKKVSKKAVIRNRLKRQLREIYRINKHILPENVSIITIAKPDILKADYNEIREDYLELLKKISDSDN
ncbi:MAG: ribonuclease P protein component [Deferribacterales bacterium]|jgi:ribonuclease P protein component|uniref:ribonuclease P protein component n=1 Tax=Deferrivibrio essentukiensis TaxID=2880922 RepID=UPI001988523E|nr:ribonuclease P protein component [Deferrivibrio essentukiensis]MBC7196929.1 ribonuclease P protein component [Deferribacterales bacterium]MCB4203909.1 ribonuclease P protein component [Deferrivibrio essentukiensis]